MFVLDTNILIYYFKGMGNVSNNLREHSPSEIAIPTVVLYELYTGIRKSSAPQKRKIQLSEIERVVNILPFDQSAARATAEVRVELELQGQVIGPYDLMIAGTAIANGGVLVTRNTKEFSKVSGLINENWY